MLLFTFGTPCFVGWVVNDEPTLKIVAFVLGMPHCCTLLLPLLRGIPWISWYSYRDHAHTSQVLHARDNWVEAKLGHFAMEKNYHHLKNDQS